MAEAEDLKSSQCGFDPHSGHLASESICSFEPVCAHYEPNRRQVQDLVFTLFRLVCDGN